ncbi:sialidase family protein [Telmatospirillum siberiense]|uniref:Glycosyl hydrolase n=1 Tax=Telmatospirillum siberiense TaxID=382514 RepID=A0A2N3PZF1_9PROT|nr:exo-alpha-sialidase [Telmatospirillum siberiense]PKU25759.1 glycosyl hydrolase [Telmatospirillum siberiense]
MTDLSVINELPMDGVVRVNPVDAARSEAYLPSPCVQNHAANLTVLPNGDLACVWFGGTQEGIADISVYFSRLRRGGDKWSPAVRLSDDQTRSEQNPVLFPAPDGRLWLLYTAQISGRQDTALVRYRVSSDNGETWGPVSSLFDEPGIFIRQPIVVLDNGDWLLPIFHCRTQPGEKWVGDDDNSAVRVSSDRGASWTEYEVPNSVGCVHMNIVKRDDGGLVALFRSRWADNIYFSRSIDGGRSWENPKPLSISNNNSSIQVTALANGHLALVCNPVSSAAATERRTSLYDEIEDNAALETATASIQRARTAFWGTPRAPLSLAISLDGGRSWPMLRDLETGDGYCMTNNSQEKANRELSYPSVKQTPDGRIHVAFTYHRQAIKYICLDESWVTP